MQYKFTIPLRLPGLNEYVNACRGNAYSGANVKKQVETAIFYVLAQQLPGLRIHKPVHVDFLWVEQNKRRDKDNIAFGKKFILDALQKAKVLSGDGWTQVDGFTDSFAVCRNNPHVEVTITEVEQCPTK